jgi:hypothetical protein
MNKENIMRILKIIEHSKLLVHIIIITIISIFLMNCSSPTDSKYDSPSDHTISKNGAKHKNGLNSPLDNCISCHGSDLLGGDTGVSCYECHSKKW